MVVRIKAFGRVKSFCMFEQKYNEIMKKINIVLFTLILLIMCVSIIWANDELKQRCPKCGVSNLPEYNYCIKCGKKLLKSHTQDLKNYGIGLQYAFVYGYSEDFNVNSNYGMALTFDYIHASGFGFQFNPASGYEYEASDTINGLLVMDKYFLTHYFLSTILKYHYKYSSSISPNFGIGGSLQRYSYFEAVESGIANFAYDEFCFAPIINVGIDFFARKSSHLMLDFKYFFGKKAGPYNTSVIALSLGVSRNW